MLNNHHASRTAIMGFHASVARRKHVPNSRYMYFQLYTSESDALFVPGPF